MNYIKSNFKEYKMSKEERRSIKHSLDLYNMYEEYTNECNKLLVKIKELNVKLDKNENEVMEYIDHKNRLLNENEFSKLYLDLNKNLEEAYQNREEFTQLLKKFEQIDNTKDTNLKNKLINELNIKDGYRKFKNNITKANDFNEKFIENLSKKREEIEENFNIVGEENIKINSDVVKDFNKKIGSINSKITRNKDSISKNNAKIKGLMDELNSFLDLNGYKDVNVYRNYLHNLKFILKKY